MLEPETKGREVAETALEEADWGAEEKVGEEMGREVAETALEKEDWGTEEKLGW